MKISFTSKGDFSKTIKFLNKVKNVKINDILSKYGAIGVNALSQATPKDSGVTSRSWNYKIEVNNDNASIVWYNTNVVKGVNIAVILQYGHGTRNGGWVEGRDYINPAMKPIFDKIADQVWKEVINNV